MRTKLDLTLKVTCDYCGRDYELKVNQKDYQLWKQGSLLIQDAFPYLNPSERELLISHCCGVCWNSIMINDPMYDDDEGPLDINDYV